MTSPSLLQRRARCLRWGVRTVWGVRCARLRARGAERRQSRPHTASPMGLRKLHRGRVDSRHFRRHRGFIPEGSLFVSLRATGYLLTIFLFCLPLSVRLLISRFAKIGERKNRSVVFIWHLPPVVKKGSIICSPSVFLLFSRCPTSLRPCTPLRFSRKSWSWFSCCRPLACMWRLC